MPVCRTILLGGFNHEERVQNMLDTEQAHITETGTVTITADGITVDGFDADNASCRDLAALAALWAIGELQRELLKTLERPGGGNIGIN